VGGPVQLWGRVEKKKTCWRKKPGGKKKNNIEREGEKIKHLGWGVKKKIKKRDGPTNQKKKKELVVKTIQKGKTTSAKAGQNTHHEGGGKREEFLPRAQGKEKMRRKIGGQGGIGKENGESPGGERTGLRRV